MRYGIVLGFLAVNLVAASSLASIVQVNFAGGVTFSMATGFAKGIPEGPPSPGGEPDPEHAVKGIFIYDTNIPAVINGDHAEYRQHRAGGFYVEVGRNKFYAEDYDVIFSNDQLVPFSDPPIYNDVLTVRFQSDVTPPLGSPIWMNGASQPGGLLSISLFGLPSLSGTPGLPSALAPESFLFGLGLLSHVPQGTLDALFIPTVTSITPEPSAEWLALCAVLVTGVYYGRSSIFRRLNSIRRSKLTC